jgi:hypothetical protein
MRSIKITFSILAIVTSASVPAIAQECKPLNVLIATDMRFERGVPVIPVTIGDASKKLVVNTASVFSDLSQPAIKDLNLNTLQARVRLVNNAGQRSDRYVILPALGIGNAKSEAVKFMVSPAPGPMNPNDPSLVGVLGPDIMQNYDVDMDFGSQKLQLISHDHCDGKVVYWAASTIAIVPMRLAEDGKTVISVDVDGKKLDAVVNTGQVNTTMNLDVAEDRFKVDVNAPDMKQVGQVGNNASAKIYRRQFQTLTFEGVTIQNPEINLVPDEVKALMRNKNQPRTGSLTRGDAVTSRLADLTLGMSTLRKLHVYIAYREKKVYITESAPSPAAALPATSAAQ